MKPSYVHELREQGAVCDSNFIRLHRLLPAFMAEQTRTFRIAAGRELMADMDFLVSERFRYTATVEVHLQQHHLPEPFAQQTFKVRVYLDANTSEVMTLERTGSLKGVYHYPNPDMYHADEKAQLNRWLGEWLQMLARHGLGRDSHYAGQH